MAICRLCLFEKCLVEAHLVPRCMYELGGQGPLAVFDLREGGPPQKSQMGMYDKGILCSDCDNLLGKLDGYACKKLVFENLCITKAEDGLAVASDGEVVCYTIVDTEPELISKFVLSVLWRCHHSTRDETKGVDLGGHEDAIAEILRGKTDVFDTPYAVHIEYNSDLKVVMIGARFKQNGINLNSFYSKKFGFHLKTDKRQFEGPLRDLCLAKGRPVYAININRLNTKFGRKVVGRLQTIIKRFGTPWKKVAR